MLIAENFINRESQTLRNAQTCCQSSFLDADAQTRIRGHTAISRNGIRHNKILDF